MDQRLKDGNQTNHVANTHRFLPGVLVACVLPWVSFTTGGITTEFGGPTLGSLTGIASIVVLWRPLIKLTHWLLNGATIPIAEADKVGVFRLGHLSGLVVGAPLFAGSFLKWLNNNNWTEPKYFLFVPGVAACGYLAATIVVWSIFWVKEGFRQRG